MQNSRLENAVIARFTPEKAGIKDQSIRAPRKVNRALVDRVRLPRFKRAPHLSQVPICVQSDATRRFWHHSFHAGVIKLTTRISQQLSSFADLRLKNQASELDSPVTLRPLFHRILFRKSEHST